mmetsp:Transcript_33204/g.94418  ORF Transcript_33204/g.94418 Transcript_33204/m.94418 type:complete len:429 (-) Transcript_33204:59-1345(-)
MSQNKFTITIKQENMMSILFLLLCWFPLLAVGLQLVETTTNTRRPIGPEALLPTAVAVPESSVGARSIVSPITRGFTQQQRNRRARKLRSLRKTSSKQTTPLSAIPPSSIISMVDVDPWGVQKTQSHMNLPSWACKDANEERHLAAMKIVLERDLQKLQMKTITRQNGQTVKVVEAFPDVYGDLRLLRFLRKDKIQDPVTAAVQYREFLQWRDENRVDEIRLLIDERLRAGDNDAFRPPEDWKVVNDYLPCDIKPIKSYNGLMPVVLRLGQWDTQGISKLILQKKLSIRAFFAYWTYLLEALHLHLYQESLRTKQMVFVEETCDLNGMSLSQFSPTFVSHILKPWIHMTQSHYPETAQSITLLRPSKVFSLAWKLISPMFSKGTVAKVSMKSCSGDACFDFYPETLRKQQDAPPLYKTTMSDRYALQL